MTDRNKTRECAKCGSSATYCVAMRKDDESGLRAVSDVLRHICAICGFSEVLTDEASPDESCKPQPAAKPGDRA